MAVNVLVIDTFAPHGEQANVGRAVVDEALAALNTGGHRVTHRALVDGPFEAFMSAGERSAYHEPEPLITPETRQDASAVKLAQALLFCYPTTLFTTPAVLKSWLERVLVPGVAFVFDDEGRVQAGMTNIRRLGAITTTPHTPFDTVRHRDAGHRTTIRNLRLSCHARCRRTFVSLDDQAPDLAKVRRALGRW